MGKLLENPIQKDNTLLNIFICNFNGEIQTMNFLDIRTNIEPIEYHHRFYGWTFYDYGRVLDENRRMEIINKLKEFCSGENKKYQNVLLIYDNKPNNDNNSSLLIMRQIVRYSNYILFQPLIIYVSDSVEKNTSYYRNILQHYISQEHIEEGEEYDKLNISSFLFDENNFINKLINELWQCTIYFNQIPSIYLPMTQENDRFEIKVQKYPFTLNILLVGENGTGKSTFINILSDRKVAYESDNGIIKTNKINEYIITFKEREINKIINNNHNNLIRNDRQFNYKICDTLGFSLENKELKELIQYIKEYFEESILIKDQIHCILYFLNENNHTRIYTGVIKEFFDYIFKTKIKVIFVINYNDGKSHLCKKSLKKNFKIGFTENEYNFFFENNDNNIIELNLKKYKEVKPFGISKLMEKLENFFLEFKIPNENLNELRNINDIEKVIKKINEYSLYKDLKTINDFCIKYISKAKKLVSYSLPVIIGISFIPIPAVDDAIAVSIESGLIAAIGHTFEESAENITTAFYDLNLSSTIRRLMLVGKVILRISGVAVDILKLLPAIGTIIGGAISAGINVASIELVGNQAINYFCDKFLQSLNSEKIISMCQEYNNNIDGFKYLQKLFKFYENKQV